jgi:hypothetical protein
MFEYDDVFMDYEHETYDHNPFLGERDVIGSEDNWGINAPDWAETSFGSYRN